MKDTTEEADSADTTSRSTGQAIADTAHSVGQKISAGAQSAVEGLKTAKDFVVDKASHPGDTIEEVKEWGAEKAAQAETLLGRLEVMLATVSESLTQVRDWAASKADRVDRTLESSQKVLTNAEDTLVHARKWAREKSAKLGDVLEKSRAAIKLSAERLAAQTEELRAKSAEALERAKVLDAQMGADISGLDEATSDQLREIDRAASSNADLAAADLRVKIEHARRSIAAVELKLLDLGMDPVAVRMHGTTNPDAELLRTELLVVEKNLMDYESDLRLAVPELSSRDTNKR